MIPVYQDRFPSKDGKKTGNSFIACLASLLEMPLRGIPQPAPGSNRAAVSQTLVDMLYDAGVVLESFGKSIPDGYAIRSGYTVAGVPHSVITLQGQVIHDPHPLGLPLVRIEENWAVVKLDEAYHAAR